MPTSFDVVDLFAGPGGLAEGFSAFEAEGHRPFDIRLSVEKEASAHRTLRFRAFLRTCRDEHGAFPDAYYDFINRGGSEPDWAKLFPREWAEADHEAQRLELGTKVAEGIIDARIRDLRSRGRRSLLVGGPPCQAYSLVGRARNRGTTGYVPSEDHRHFLYREYIRILKTLEPDAFVMENVKGILSSSVDGAAVFERVLDDLRDAGYSLLALTQSEGRTTLREPAQPRDFVIRAETFGVPQARHRVIVIGVRNDVRSRISDLSAAVHLPIPPRACADDVLEGLPRLRSGLSRNDSEQAWRESISSQFDVARAAIATLPTEIRVWAMGELEDAASASRASNAPLQRSSSVPSSFGDQCPDELRAWLTDGRLTATMDHASRGHIETDLGRYLFCALFARAMDRSPKASEFPAALAPDHANWTSGKFADRFRVQRRGAPATTVTSHIAKDGHYFIHPDPVQCRSLTVREAARLQTFPDNYRFLGNRTEQYVQVGNAVPPFLARQIAAALYGALIL